MEPAVLSTPPNCQWYTTSLSTSVEKEPQQLQSGVQSMLPASPPVVELTEELTPKRPLRSEIEREKRLSRPTSIVSSNSNIRSQASTDAISDAGDSNRNSLGWLITF